jgi:2-dehydro-3-deoxygalactonokinase
MAGETQWVAVDWGTSNLRAWGIDSDGAIAFSRTSPEGMGKLTPDAFPAALERLLDGAIAGRSSVDVLICGMAGARQGWKEAPYLTAPTDLAQLGQGAVTPPMPGSRYLPRILPGVCQRGSGLEDVMRGEETQILGLGGFSGLAVLPGTHSKWVTVDGTRIDRFATAMTGELYELLRTHSVLRLSLTGDLDGPARAEGLDAGLAAGLEAPEQLSSLLFKVRASSLLSNREPAWCAGYLSGLLIGAEIGGHRAWIGTGQTEIPLIGSTALCEVYRRGFELIGVPSRLVDATEATLNGLKMARGGHGATGA